jgi:hypothetical protein
MMFVKCLSCVKNIDSYIYFILTGGAVCKGANPSVEQPGGRGFKPRLRSLLD